MDGGVAGLFHPVIAVSDMAEAVRFYRDLLGLRVTFDDYHDPAAISMLFGIREPVVHAVVVSCPDGSEIELVEFEHPRRATARRDPGQPGVMAVNLLVHGVDAIVDRLRAASVCIVGLGGVGSWAAEALARSGIEQVTRSEQSIMPTDLDQTLTDRKLADWVAYLKSL